MHINTILSFHPIWIISLNQTSNTNINFKQLIPIQWQLVLINEGSFTQNLNCLTGMKTQIIIQQKFNFSQSHNKNIRNIRCIWLETSIYTKLTFARSLWFFTGIDQIYVKLNQKKPIGNLFIKSQADIHKFVQEIYYGYCKYLEKSFNIPRPIWGRKCLLYYQGQTYAIIQEFFSPYILHFFYLP
uniref:Ycf21 n=1 Tax=Bornetia secundiflora TaxID=2575637 RepID=A0A4D6WQH3_9FLOR|nr:hypothetical protein [Bornetia secundiflora]